MLTDFCMYWILQVKFGAQSQGSGWISIAFPDNPGVMVESDAVIGWVDDDEPTVGVFKLEGKDSNSITADNDAFEITDESVEINDEGTLLTFTRFVPLHWLWHKSMKASSCAAYVCLFPGLSHCVREAEVFLCCAGASTTHLLVKKQ